MIYLTEAINDNSNAEEPRIKARSLKEAKEICRELYPGFVVIGTLVAEIELFEVCLS